jgi:hypothetical protein
MSNAPSLRRIVCCLNRHPRNTANLLFCPRTGLGYCAFFSTTSLRGMAKKNRTPSNAPPYQIRMSCFAFKDTQEAATVEKEMLK